jgi:GTP-binding protein Era
MTQQFKSGFIAILGSPNVGKSTLINRMVGQKVSIVSDKPQTTRNTIRGIVTKEDYQFVFLDTPGLHSPRNKLDEFMQKSSSETSKDVDAILYITDALIGIKERDTQYLQKFANSGIPLVVAVNKTDKAKNEKIEKIKLSLDHLDIQEAFYISALNGEGVERLEEKLKEYLVEGPKYYPDDLYTDQPERLIAAEMIREKALQLLADEVPHGVGVEIEKIEKREGREMIDVAAVIYCERQTHKGIIIGAKGSMIKAIGSSARADLQMLFGCSIYLELFVKVKEDWRNSRAMLKTLGYE